MKKYFSQQVVFLIFAALMTILIGGFVIYASYFLITRLNAALVSEPAQQEVLKFDIEGFKKLNLIK